MYGAGHGVCRFRTQGAGCACHLRLMYVIAVGMGSKQQGSSSLHQTHFKNGKNTYIGVPFLRSSPGPRPLGLVPPQNLNSIEYF